MPLDLIYLIAMQNFVAIRSAVFKKMTFKVSHSYRIWNVFAQPEVASEVRRTSHFVTSDIGIIRCATLLFIIRAFLNKYEVWVISLCFNYRFLWKRK